MPSTCIITSSKHTHHLSPTGCPLYGSRRWTKKKRWCCRVWLWLTAPLLTLFLSLVVIPIVLIVFPLGVGYKVGFCGWVGGRAVFPLGSGSGFFLWVDGLYRSIMVTVKAGHISITASVYIFSFVNRPPVGATIEVVQGGFVWV